MSDLAENLARAIDMALAHLERGKTFDAQNVLHGAQELFEASRADGSVDIDRLLGKWPAITPPAVPVSQENEE